MTRRRKTQDEMQGGQGRGSRSGRGGGGGGFGRGGGMPGASGVGYGGFPGYFYNGWGDYSNYQVQGVYPGQVPSRGSHRGSTGRPYNNSTLGVQGAGILKRPAGNTQGNTGQGRGRNRGHGGRGGRSNRKNLTKEALDADLDEYRMKDKKFGGQSLDAELDEYWKKKGEEEGEAPNEEDGKKEDGLEDGTGLNGSPEADASKKARPAVASHSADSQGDSDEEKLEQNNLSPPEDTPDTST